MSTTRRPVVLLVQQSRDDGLDMYAEFLRYSGLAPIAVSNETDALMFAPEADIIVTGIILDDHMDGVELVSRLRHDDGTMHTPVIVLTACAWPRDRERAEHAGCDVFLPKPCLPNDLLREVRLLLPRNSCTTRPRVHRRINAAYTDDGKIGERVCDDVRQRDAPVHFWKGAADAAASYSSGVYVRGEALASGGMMTKPVLGIGVALLVALGTRAQSRRQAARSAEPVLGERTHRLVAHS